MARSDAASLVLRARLSLDRAGEILEILGFAEVLVDQAKRI